MCGFDQIASDPAGVVDRRIDPQAVKRNGVLMLWWAPPQTAGQKSTVALVKPTPRKPVLIELKFTTEPAGLEDADRISGISREQQVEVKR